MKEEPTFFIHTQKPINWKILPSSYMFRLCPNCNSKHPFIWFDNIEGWHLKCTNCNTLYKSEEIIKDNK